VSKLKVYIVYFVCSLVGVLIPIILVKEEVKGNSHWDSGTIGAWEIHQL